jgi:hypothetical protein
MPATAMARAIGEEQRVFERMTVDGELQNSLAVL